MREVSADFNTLQIDPSKIILAKVGFPTADRLAGCREGEHVLLKDDDIQVEATLHIENGIWVGLPDWKTRQDLN